MITAMEEEEDRPVLLEVLEEGLEEDLGVDLRQDLLYPLDLEDLVPGRLRTAAAETTDQEEEDHQEGVPIGRDLLRARVPQDLYLDYLTLTSSTLPLVVPDLEQPLLSPTHRKARNPLEILLPRPLHLHVATTENGVPRLQVTRDDLLNETETVIVIVTETENEMEKVGNEL